MTLSKSIPTENIRQTHYRACHLCEAICGLEIKTENDTITSIKGDNNDPFSGGHLCPKAMALKDLQEDPNRIKMPMKRVGEQWQEISWEEALNEVTQNIVALQQQYGNDTVGVYAGNPNVHNYGNLTHGRLLRKALQTRNNFSATSLDQLPHHLVAWQLYGHQFMLPIPDIDNTDYMVIIGGNPLVSNGSIMTAPNVTKKLQSIQKRGGEFVVVDPRRTETAKAANQHHFIRPGTDVFLLLAIAQHISSNQNIKLLHLETWLDGMEQVLDMVKPFTPELAASHTGISAEVIKDIADKLTSTPRATIYGRMGVSVQEYGTLCQWLIQIINIMSGHLDTEGGNLVTSPAVGYVQKGTGGVGHFGNFHSRVSGLPEFAGEFPVATMAEEMLTPGDGQIKAMFTIAGNPVLSAVNGQQMESAFAGLEYMVAIDFYINETTRFANIILPPPSPLEHEQYDYAFLRLAVRNTTRFNPAIFEKAPAALHDWEIYNQLGEMISNAKGIAFKPLPDPKHLIDWELKNGPYGEESELQLSLQKLIDEPHGIDLGPLKPSLTERLATENGKINLWRDDWGQAVSQLTETALPDASKLLLIGRRHIRSNNSWMHNYSRLVKGKPHWQLLMHPDDLQARNIEDGANIKITSRVGEVVTQVKASDEVMAGVVSLPHGWGHQRKGVVADVATLQQGVSVNDLTDEKYFDPISGNAALNGVPVEVALA